MYRQFQDTEPVVLRKPGTQGPRPAATAKPAGANAGDKKMFAGTNNQQGQTNGAAIERNYLQPAKTVGQDFKKAMEAARAAKGWSRKELAEKTYLPLQTIASYENGTATPNGTVIDKLNKALGVTLPKMQKAKKVKQDFYDDEM